MPCIEILSKLFELSTYDSKRIGKNLEIKYLHTMVRVKDLEKSITFYNLLGLKEIKRNENKMGRFTLVFLAPEDQHECPLELTFNWDGDDELPSDSRHFGHLAYEVENIYEMCQFLAINNVVINRPPRWKNGIHTIPR